MQQRRFSIILTEKKPPTAVWRSVCLYIWNKLCDERQRKQLRQASEKTTATSVRENNCDERQRKPNAKATTYFLSNRRWHELHNYFECS